MRKVTYVKRCLSEKCVNRQQCEHGKAQIRFRQHFPKGFDEVPDYMLDMFKAIYPVHCLCQRFKMSREQCIDLQNELQAKINRL